MFLYLISAFGSAHLSSTQCGLHSVFEGECFEKVECIKSPFGFCAYLHGHNGAG